jgi:hypothetical protein
LVFILEKVSVNGIPHPGKSAAQKAIFSLCVDMIAIERMRGPVYKKQDCYDHYAQ